MQKIADKGNYSCLAYHNAVWEIYMLGNSIRMEYNGVDVLLR